MSVKTVLFIVTNAGVIGPNQRKTGYFFPEVAHPFEVFDKAGIAVEFASPQGGPVHEDGYDAKDPLQLAFRQSSAIRRLSHSRKLSEVDVLDYDAIFFPGGLGPMVDIYKDADVKHAVIRAWNGGKIVSAVCHGPAAFLDARFDDGTPLLQGRKLTAFSNAEEEGYAKADVPFLLESALRAQGAEHFSAAPWQPKVIVDGRLMTGQNPASGGPLAEAIVAVLQQQPGASPSAGVVVNARWQVNPESLDQVLALLPEVRKQSLAEAGCQGYEAYRSLEDANALLLVERYRDQAAVEAHRASSHYQDLVAGRILPLLKGRKVELLKDRDLA